MPRIVRTLSTLSAFLAVSLLTDSSAFSGEANDKQTVPAIEVSCDQSTITFRQQTLRRLTGAQIEKFIVGRAWTYVQGEEPVVYMSTFRAKYYPDGTFSQVHDLGWTTAGHWRIADFRLCTKYSVETKNTVKTFKDCRCSFASEEEEYFLISDDEGDVKVPLKLEFLEE